MRKTLPPSSSGLVASPRAHFCLVWAAMAECHGPGDSTHSDVLLAVLEAQSLRSGCQCGWVLGEGHLPAVSSHGRKARSGVSSSFHRKSPLS